jgi:hypothetical protein
MNLPIELKTRIYEHIGHVQQHLGELPADEKREILQSLETHVHDALTARSNGEPTLEMLEAIIAEMDPPESYGSATPLFASSGGPSISGRGKILFFGVIGTLCALFIAIWLADPFGAHWMDHEESTTPPQAPPAKNPAPAPEVSGRPSPPPGIVGKWTAVDFVSNISDFTPRTTNWESEFAVKELQFLADGTTDKAWWTWKDDKLLHSGDKSTAGFMIAKIDQKDYLFLEWISGDILRDGKKPKYYVFRRGGHIDPNEPKIIQEGVGWGALRIGATTEDVIAELGEPASTRTSTFNWHNLSFSCLVSNGKAERISFLQDFDGATEKGIKIGSTEAELLEAYGNPDHISYGSTMIRRAGQTKPDVGMTWNSGVQVSLNPEVGVKIITVFAPTKTATD